MRPGRALWLVSKGKLGLDLGDEDCSLCFPGEIEAHPCSSSERASRSLDMGAIVDLRLGFGTR